ncbi:MAG TPA: hypothetical protein DCE18_17540 [Syntrophobacteraceae bacterium]|nr:hypothetical protein [Syntrophobacteraceae bacterium]HBZ56491.1 hypothetical protein [Syntrophobacteraceae bacterium]
MGESMVKNSKHDEDMIEEFESEEDLEFTQDDELDFAEEDVDILLDEEDEEDILPSVLSKGANRPKTDDDWRQLLLQANKAGVPEYRMEDNYHDGALILHQVFGLGVVTKVITAKKMEVIFENTKKLMAMGVTPPN